MTSPLPNPESSTEAAPKLVAVRGQARRPALQRVLIPGVTLALLAAAWLFRPARPAATAAVLTPTARATRGALGATRRVSGSIVAGRFANIAAPVLRAPDQGRGL